MMAIDGPSSWPRSHATFRYCKRRKVGRGLGTRLPSRKKRNVAPHNVYEMASQIGQKHETDCEVRNEGAKKIELRYKVCVKFKSKIEGRQN